MKYRLPLFISIILTFIFINGCSGKVNNSVTSRNSVIVQEIPKGIYDYNTTYSLPVGSIGGSIQGDYKGTLTITAGTKITILYSSTQINGSYIVFASVSSSDDQGTVTSP